MKTKKAFSLISCKPFVWVFCLILFVVLATHNGITSANCEITDIGGLNGGDESTGFRVSANGKVVVGWARDGAAKGAIRAFRWTREGGMQSLGNLNGGWISFALDTNADGSVVVGYATDGAANNQKRAFRWDKASGMQLLGMFPGTKYPASATSYAYGISDDGSVITGYASGAIPGEPEQVLYWTEDVGMRSLATLDKQSSSNWPTKWMQGHDTDAHGNVIVGQAWNDKNNDYPTSAFIWTKAKGLKLIGPYNSETNGVSSDGKMIAGYTSGENNKDIQAFRWNETDGMKLLGKLRGGSESRAFGISGDGSVVVGHASDGGDGDANRAFRWAESGGIQTVEEWLRANGTEIPKNITKAAYSTNRRGNVVVGQLANEHAFIVACDVDDNATMEAENQYAETAPSIKDNFQKASGILATQQHTSSAEFDLASSISENPMVAVLLICLLIFMLLAYWRMRK